VWKFQLCFKKIIHHKEHEVDTGLLFCYDISMYYTANRKKRVLAVAILMVAAVLLLFNQLFFDGATAEAVDFFFVFFALVAFFSIGISCECPPLSRWCYSFTRRPPPSLLF